MSKLIFLCYLLPVVFCGSCSNNTCENPTPYISNGRIYFNGFSLRSKGRTIISCEEIQQDVGTIKTDGIILSYQNLVGMSKNDYAIIHTNAGGRINKEMITKKDTILGYLAVQSLYQGSGKEIATLYVADLDDIPDEQSLYNKGYLVAIFTEFNSEKEYSKIKNFFSSLEIED